MRAGHFFYFTFTHFRFPILYNTRIFQNHRHMLDQTFLHTTNPDNTS